jgi:hypothetical protein
MEDMMEANDEQTEMTISFAQQNISPNIQQVKFIFFSKHNNSHAILNLMYVNYF